MKLFPPRRPPEDVAMDLLGQLWPIDRGHTQLLVVVDRFTKMAFAYGFPKIVLTDNGKQFKAKLLQQIYRILGVKLQFTKMYHLKANCQTKRFNRTILSSLIRCIVNHPKDWDPYTDALTYAYNTQAPSSTGYALMELTI
eukprot:IDg16426t1